MVDRARRWRRRSRREPDERIASESNRIFRLGFLLLLIGYLVYVWHGFMVEQVAHANGLQLVGANPSVDPFVRGWFLLVCAVVSVLLVRRGVLPCDDQESCGAVDVPSFLYAPCGLAALVFVLALLMRLAVELELVGLEGVSVHDDFIVAAAFASMTFFAVALLGAILLFVARRRRVHAGAEFDGD